MSAYSKRFTVFPAPKSFCCFAAKFLSVCCFIISTCHAQELEPRRWGHLPVNSNFIGIGYGYTDSNIAFDPALQIKDVKLDLHSYGIKYIRSFELFGKTARAEIIPIFQEARWKGLLRGKQRSTRRIGMADPIVRFAINLLGAPPLEGKDYLQFRQSMESETIVGLGLAVHLPLGKYYEDKLLNLGANRFLFRPQLGVVHEWDRWSIELTGSTWLYTDNDDFYDSTELEQDPFYTIQSQLTYDFYPGLWIAGAAGYGIGAESTIDGVSKDDEKENIAWALSFGFPITRGLAGRIAYIGIDTQASTGSDSNTISFALAHNF